MTATAPRARPDPRVKKEIREIKARLAHLENLALRENQALSDLLDRLESLLAAAQQFWFQRTTLLRMMITISGLVLMVQLLSLFPQIAPLVAKLL
jgi:hypothetical protein